MIKLKNVNKVFQRKNKDSIKVLTNISLEVGKNKCAILHGNSGSGKTTLLHIIASLMKPSSGRIEINNKNIVSFSDYHASIYRHKTVAYMTQSFYLFESLSVEENLLPSLILESLSAAEMKQKLNRALKLANIFHKAKQKVSTLSGGEKQRCIIARAIVNDPDIILCDEPTANLDKENSFHFIEIMKRLKERGKTILMATHDPLLQNLEWVDTLFYMEDGHLE